MFLSPPEIKQQQLREKRGAYEREDVDALIDNIVGSYQHVWLERDRLQARVAELEQEMANTKELEQLLRDGLASAQRAAEQVKEEAQAQVSGLVDEARSKAETLLAEARAKADELVAASRETRNRLQEETSRLQRANHDVRERYQAFLLEALSLVKGTAEHKAVTAEEVAVAEADESAPAAEPEEEPEGWLATVALVAHNADSIAEETERAVEPEPEPEAAADEQDAPATVLLSAVPTPEPEAAPEPEPEPEPEPQAEPLAPDEAYMTFRGLSAVSVEEQPQAPVPEPEPEPEDDAGEDAYEDWTPKKP